jgi:hypothetical protein
MKSYIIETIALELEGGRERAGKQFWHSTHTSLCEAKQEYAKLVSDRGFISLLLLAWESGNIEPSGEPLKHRNFSQRQCDGGMPTLTVLAHADKLFVPPQDRGQGKVVDLITYTDKVGNTLQIGGGNGYTLTPRISQAWLGRDGSTLYNWPIGQPVPAGCEIM